MPKALLPLLLLLVLAAPLIAQDAEPEPDPQPEAVAEPGMLDEASEWLRDSMPAALRRTAFVIEHWQWIGLVLLAFAGIAFDRLTVFFLLTLVVRLLKRSGVEPDRDNTRSALRPFGLLFMAVLWWIGVDLLGLPDEVQRIIGLAVRFLTAAAAVWASYRLVDVLTDALRQRAARTAGKFDDLLVPLFRKGLKVFVVAFGLVFIADNLDIDITSLVAGLGLGGLAFALAAQDVAKNLFGSITVLMDRPFEVGDWVVIEGVEGTVESVGFRSTRVRTFYNSVVAVPNSALLTKSVDNYGLRKFRRWKTTIGLTYDTPPDKIEAFTEGVRELIRRSPWTRKDYFHVYLNAFAPSSLDVLVYMFFEVPDWGTELRERQRLAVDILRLAERLGVSMAFPTQTIIMDKGAGGKKAKPTLPKPKDSDKAEAAGRKEARAILKATLGDLEQKPPPVSYDVSHGEMDEGEE